MTAVQFPAMRGEVIRALASLADVAYQRRAWIDGRFGSPESFEDLTLNIHVLYDDCMVLPNPRSMIGTVLVDGDEILALEALNAPLDQVLGRLHGAADIEYLDADEWPEVVHLASIALAAMVRRGGCL